MSILHKADSFNSNSAPNRGEVALNAGQRREYEVLIPARELVRNALAGAGFADIVIEADMPQTATQEARLQQSPQAVMSNILNEAVEFVPAPYLQDQLQDRLETQQEVPVAQAVMQQTVRNPEYN
jgi:hypothetical protein